MRSMSVALLALVLAMPAMAAVPDPAINNRIIDAAMNHGEVMETAEYLTDHIGGRMTNSPQMRAAEQWTKQRFASYGLSDARLEPFEFGAGWSIDSVEVRMLSPAGAAAARHSGGMDAGDRRRPFGAGHRRAAAPGPRFRQMAWQARRQDRAGQPARRWR